ncbi:MAG: tRNA (adenosine(37)-N6)-threonylcarbamoyltransferase complex ATPase subunit type 1 TsaE [Pseudomonadota bacterium]
MQLTLSDETATERFGARLAERLAEAPVDAPLIVYLTGDLGSGKTTLARAVLRAGGVGGPVKSPTYTLIEPYELTGRRCYHLDLYRLADAQELEFLGLEDWLAERAILLVEWPERGLGVLPEPDLSILLERTGGSSRQATLSVPDDGFFAGFTLENQ